MKIAFFGAFGSFDYFKIGGTESFVRRLASGLIGQGHEIGLVVYGAPEPHHRVLPPGIGCFYFTELKTALQFLGGIWDHVITIYLRPLDRLPYLYFRWLHRQRLYFHQVFFGWPDSLIKREASFLDARLYPYNGYLCISPRLYRKVNRWSNRAVLLLPPVPENYFLEPAEKPKHDKLRVTYIGRIEPGKGIDDVIELFSRLRDNPEVELEIYGYHHKHMKAAVETHEQLRHQEQIRYFYRPYESFTPEVEQEIRHILRDTDILVLPYRQLSSTIDTPVLLLEGMASLCAIVTRSLGDIPAIYGPSPFLMSESASMDSMADCLLRAKKLLVKERHRIQRRNRELRFGIKPVVSRLIKALD